MSVKKSVANMITIFTITAGLGAGGVGTAKLMSSNGDTSSVSQIVENMSSIMDSIPFTLVEDKLVEPQETAMVDEDIVDSLGNVTGTHKVSKVIKDRIVDNINVKVNPAWATMEGDSIFSFLILKRNDTSKIVHYGCYVPLPDRLVVQYFTTAEN